MNLRTPLRRGLPGTFAALVFISAVTWAASSSASEGGCPRDMALVGATCVDKYEASLVEVSADGTERPWSAYETPAGHNVRAVSVAGVPPQAHVSMVDAQRSCKASGKRLCRAKEWKAACRGPEGTKYPYGNERQANACVDTGRTSPVLVKYAGEHTARTMNDPALNQTPNTIEMTGDAAACTNAYGVHDMVGNVHEWTDDGAFRGGYYLDTKINGEGCDYVTTAHSPVYYDYSTGFRCCADEGALPSEEEPAPAPAAVPERAPHAPADLPTTRPGAPLGDDGTWAWLGASTATFDGSPRRRREVRARAALVYVD